jgi:DNA-binding transcriptional MerR regulator
MSDPMTLAEIANASGVAARTIRFYIARGILDGPAKAGRGAAYTAAHLERLGRIQKLQAQGRTLSEINHILQGAAAGSPLSQPAPWWQHAIADDIAVWVRADVSPWRMKQIRAAIEELADRLRPADGKGRNQKK